MKKIVMVIVAVALIAAGVFGTLAVQRTFEPSISLSSTSSFALFNWENKQDTAEALKVAQQDAEGKVNQANMLEQAKAQAHTLVENLLKPFTVGDNAYTVTVVDQ